MPIRIAQATATLTLSELEPEPFGFEELQEMADDPGADEDEVGFVSDEDSGDEIWEIGEAGPGPQSQSAQRAARFRAPSEIIQVPHDLQPGFIDLTEED